MGIICGIFWVRILCVFLIDLCLTDYSKTMLNTGIYVGENKVIHFTAPETANSGSGWNMLSTFQSSCFNSIDSGYSLPKNGQTYDSLTPCDCGFQQSQSGVILTCLNCFIGTGSLYLFQYGVNKFAYVTKLRGGTCTTAPSDPPEEVTKRAEYLLKKGFGTYNVVRRNCEDFALYCKTGLLVCGKRAATGSSGQVNFLFNGPLNFIVDSQLPKLVLRCTGAGPVAFAVGSFFWNRYNDDIGVRDDVVKVRVEDVGLFIDGGMWIR